jgi:hypothetical protein
MLRGALVPDGQTPQTAGEESSGRASVLVFLATCAVLLLVCGLAEARIVPQQGIKGINLLMTRSQVVQKKGQPDSDHVVANEILGHVRVTRYGKTKVTFNGVSNSSRVITVSTRDRRQRTKSGVGVGSTETAVKNKVQGIHCRTDAGSRHCFKGSFRPGKRVTDFSISTPGHRVTRVTVGIVID